VAASIALWLGVKREDLVKPPKKTDELEEVYTEEP
jgi:preprotein translocase subunit SecF